METKTLQPTTKKASKRESIEINNIEFGKVATDHMFIAEYANGKWEAGAAKAFQNLSLSPFTAAFHYGQTVFEGMKAFKTDDGKINIFRLHDHFLRFNKSLRRMCMPELTEKLFTNAILELIKADTDWVPSGSETSLYIRPFMIASDDKIGVHISDNYIFMVVCSPAGKYYSEPLKVKIETHYTRACEGGTGEAKCGGNYGGAYYPFQLAKKEGFDQIIWTDAKTHEFVEESGTMNLGFIVDNKLVTPLVGNTVLEGITRDSLLKIAPEMGLKVEVRPVRYKEIFGWIEAGKKVEAFGIGTAALIAPIKEISLNNKSYLTYTGDDATMFQLKQLLCDIRSGKKADKYGWNFLIGSEK